MSPRTGSTTTTSTLLQVIITELHPLSLDWFLLLLRHAPLHVLQYLQLGFHGSGSLTRAITSVMPLIPTFIASRVSLIVSSSRTPTVSGQVTNSLAVCALYSALAIVMKLALVAQW
ncbi:hypothetical protein Tco_1320839 [Tanacetum coccineum]